MNTYEYSVKKTLIGNFTVEAASREEAREMVRDHARRIILVNNQSPWTIEILHENLIDEIQGE
jgi:hypothetical protein